MSEICLYRVGGCVRDEIMGHKPKDIDYAIEAPSYAAMVAWVRDQGTVWQERPQFQTVRAKVTGIDADFVLCRRWCLGCNTFSATPAGRTPTRHSPGRATGLRRRNAPLPYRLPRPPNSP